MHLINCSLNPNSKGRKIYHQILKDNPDLKGIDLIDTCIPACNGYEQSSYTHENVKKIHDALLPSKGLLFITPIYNWDVSSTAKNFIELLGTPYKDILSGDVFRNKVVGVIVTAGSNKSFLAPLGFLNSMLVDFQSFIVPQYTLLTKEDFKEDGTINMTSINETLQYFRFMAKALSDFKKVV